MTLFVTECDKCGTQSTDLKVGASCVANHTAYNYQIVLVEKRPNSGEDRVLVQCCCGWSSTREWRKYLDNQVSRRHDCEGHMKFVTVIDADL